MKGIDKNTIIGLGLIFGVFILFFYINQPSQEEVDAAKHQRDSIAFVQKQEAIKAAETALLEEKNKPAAVAVTDAVQQDEAGGQLVELYGKFANAAVGEDEIITLENNLMKIEVAAKGGRIYSVELKNYKRHDSLPLVLFEGQKSDFGLEFSTSSLRNISTEEFFFVPDTDEQQIVVSGPEAFTGKEGREKFNEKNKGEEKSLSMRLYAGEEGYIEYKYTIRHNSYMIGFDVNMVGMNNIVASNSNYLNLNWNIQVPRQEKISSWGEDRYSTIYYKYFGDEVDNLKTKKSGEEVLRTRVKWISFKQLFFSSTLISDDAFTSAEVRTEFFGEEDPRYPGYLGNYQADIAVPYDFKANETIPLQFYFGPNHYNTLRQYGLDMEDVIDLGWVAFINKGVIIPIFNWLSRYLSNFGLIILILTIMIKTVLFPLTYKSYKSQAKMRALKPEIDELNKKFSADKSMEKQQATMALYKKAGVNPMGGCLPMLLQFPVLIAMFYFFPTSIELRQQSFLWAHDLSTYDSVLNLPFTIPMYGDHVSLFCLLMTITTVISTRLNSASQAGGQQMAGMKTMMYMMPVMFLFILNNYSAGLSYYYLLANLITIGQTYIARRFIDEEKIRARLQANKKKPAKKSKFQERLEKAAKARGVKN